MYLFIFILIIFIDLMHNILYICQVNNLSLNKYKNDATSSESYMEIYNRLYSSITPQGMEIVQL